MKDKQVKPVSKTLPLFTPNVFALIESYGKGKSVPLTAVLNAIIDFEQEKRVSLCT